MQPGSCWAFQGSRGHLVIELSANITPTAFTLEHIPKSIAPEGKIDSAPKEFTVLVWYLETRWYQRKKNFHFLHMILLHIFWFEIFDLMDILIKWHCIFLVQGLSNEFDTVGSNLGNFTYNESGPPLQTFSIKVTK